MLLVLIVPSAFLKCWQRREQPAVVVGRGAVHEVAEGAVVRAMAGP